MTVSTEENRDPVSWLSGTKQASLKRTTHILTVFVSTGDDYGEDTGLDAILQERVYHVI